MQAPLLVPAYAPPPNIRMIRLFHHAVPPSPPGTWLAAGPMGAARFRPPGPTTGQLADTWPGNPAAAWQTGSPALPAAAERMQGQDSYQLTVQPPLKESADYFHTRLKAKPSSTTYSIPNHTENTPILSSPKNEITSTPMDLQNSHSDLSGTTEPISETGRSACSDELLELDCIKDHLNLTALLVKSEGNETMLRSWYNCLQGFTSVLNIVKVKTAAVTPEIENTLYTAESRRNWTKNLETAELRSRFSLLHNMLVNP